MRPVEHISNEIMKQMKSFKDLYNPEDKSWNISVPTYRIIQGLEKGRKQVTDSKASVYLEEMAKIIQLVGKWDAISIRARENGAIEFRTQYPIPRSEPEVLLIEKMMEHDVAVFVLDQDKLLVDVRAGSMEQTKWINDMFTDCGDAQSHVIARHILSIAYTELLQIFRE